MNQKSASSLQFEVSYQQFLQTFFFYNGGFWGKKFWAGTFSRNSASDHWAKCSSLNSSIVNLRP